MSTIATPAELGSRSHSQYIRKERLIAMAVNGLFSAAFVFIVFGRREEIPLWGARGLAVDFVPQTFIISLMTVLVATLLTRRRVTKGEVPASAVPTRLPRNIVVRAGLLAAMATLVLGGIGTLVLAALGGGQYAFANVLAFKIVYGVLVAAIVATIALRAALADARH